MIRVLKFGNLRVQLRLPKLWLILDNSLLFLFVWTIERWVAVELGVINNFWMYLLPAYYRIQIVFICLKHSIRYCLPHLLYCLLTQLLIILDSPFVLSFHQLLLDLICLKWVLSWIHAESFIEDAIRLANFPFLRVDFMIDVRNKVSLSRLLNFNL